jgi:flagellar L-ring protein precursor FlgH
MSSLNDSSRPAGPCRAAVRVLAALCLLSLAACSLGGRVAEDYDALLPPDPGPTGPANGAIYQAGYDVPLFENAVARRIGDIVTIRLVENTNASKSSSTSTKKTTEATLAGPTVAGRPVTVNGVEVLSGGIANDNSFDGEGSSRQSNRLTGDITVAVVRRFANGNLLVRGEKWIGINQGREFVRLTGIIRPIDIEPDNSVPSPKVANAHIEYGGRGALADANAPGWLARFFNSPRMPF